VSVITVCFSISTKGGGEVLDLTPEVQRSVRTCGLQSGIAAIFVPGSTAGVTTAEFEPGVAHDLRMILDRLVPPGTDYRHNVIDDNGRAHVQAALVGPSVTVPFSRHSLLLGRWQQIILIDFDTRPRKREVICQIIGER
jgi:secondary thiamine-phosphate synthase enzyme